MTPICDCCEGDHAVLPEFHVRARTIWRCSDCGLLMAPQADWIDHEASAPVQRRAEQARTKEFSEYVELARVHSSGRRWLDIGAGSGGLMFAALQAGYQVEGIEVRPDRVAEILRCSPDARVHTVPAEQASLPAVRFAVVSMINVFSHLRAPLEVMRKVRDSLSVGGVLIMRTGTVGVGCSWLGRRVVTRTLGDENFWLGQDTISFYASKCGYSVIYRRDEHVLRMLLSRQNLDSGSPSSVKALGKKVLRILPPPRFVVDRLAMTAGIPVHSSLLLLRAV
jgi:SAM-dependent methyltransferase